MKVSTAGLKKEKVLAALYNASKPQGMGFMQYNPNPMTDEEARRLLQRSTYFDYLKGRVMKIDLQEDDGFEAGGYDRDNGQGAAQKAIDELRRTGQADTPAIRETHRERTIKSADRTEGHLGTRSSFNGNTIELGLTDVAHVLGPAIKDARKKLS
jgi:hypothetical protein